MEGTLLSPTRRLEDVPELQHLIQTLLPVKEAATTCLLSKSWLLAWHTNPSLRFPVLFFDKEQELKFINLINRHLLRYHRNNAPIVSFRLPIYIQKHYSAFILKTWIRKLTTKTSPLKQLSLEIFVLIDSFTLPGEIFAGPNLDTISVIAGSANKNLSQLWMDSDIFYENLSQLWMSSDIVINCVSLRVLELIEVHITEDVLDNLLTTCRLLEKINIFAREGLKRIKVKNLHSLRELKISSKQQDNILEIVDVPNLRLLFYDLKFLTYDLKFLNWYPRLPLINMDSLGSVKELFLGYGIVDAMLFDMVISNLPFLEALTIEVYGYRDKESLDITCVSLKRLTLIINSWEIQIRVFTPKLLFFCYHGIAVPSLVFLITDPEQITLRLALRGPLKYPFFVDMRKALEISSKFDIEIINRRRQTYLLALDFDVDGLKTTLPFPAMNVQGLTFSKQRPNKFPWEYSLSFDAFFSVCHPTYIKAYKSLGFRKKKYFYKLMKSIEEKIKEGYWCDLKDVELKNPLTRKWESLANNWRSFPNESAVNRWDFVEFKLHWCSP